MIAYPDACPECDPFDSPPSLPIAVSNATGDAWYQCRAGHVWYTRRDGWGWPAGRWLPDLEARHAAA